MSIDSAAKRASIPGVARPWHRTTWPDSAKGEGWRHSVGNSYAGVADEVAPPVVGGTGDATLSTSSGIAGLSTATGEATLSTSSGIACLSTASGEATLRRSTATAGLASAAGEATLRPTTAVAALRKASGDATLSTSSGTAGLSKASGEATLATSSIETTGFRGEQRAQEAAQ
jgi:hypothetical protein